MKVRVLGCSGGIGGRHLRTTSMLVDHDILIDAGTGVGELSLDELKAFNPHIEADVFEALSLEGSLNARNTLGGTAPAQA